MIEPYTIPTRCNITGISTMLKLNPYFNINFFNIDVKFGLSFNIVEIPVILHLVGTVYGSIDSKQSYIEFTKKSSILLNSTIVCNSVIIMLNSSDDAFLLNVKSFSSSGNNNLYFLIVSNYALSKNLIPDMTNGSYDSATFNVKTLEIGRAHV